MCFSATASFVAAGLLTGIGATALYVNKQKSYLMFALIPLMFAIQQASEGIVWLTIASTQGLLHQAAKYLFMSFAGIVWPLWSSLSLLAVEQHTFRRMLLLGLAALGASVACYTIWIFATEPIQAHVISCSIDYAYTTTIPIPHLVGLLLYTIATVGPCFVSSLHNGRLLGSCWLFALLVTMIIRYETLASVWCFFAAMLSMLIVWVIWKEQGFKK